MSDLVRGSGDLYAQYPELRALATIGATAISAPIGGILGPLDAAVGGVLQKMREKRLDLFLQALAKHRGYFTPDLVQSEPFLQRFILTLEAVLRTEHAEKIRLFARLLTAAARGDRGTDFSDNFDQFLGILDELTMRELRILRVIDQLEWKHANASGERKPLEDQAYVDIIARELKVLPEAVLPMLSRLARTGLSLPPSYGGLTFGAAPEYLLTPLFKRFTEWVHLTAKDRRV